MNKILIDLDNKTLNDLLGGKSEAEITLRNGIVENFTHKRLRSLLNEKSMIKHIERIEQALIETVEKTAKQYVKEHLQAVQASYDALIKKEIDNFDKKVNQEVIRRMKLISK